MRRVGDAPNWIPNQLRCTEGHVVSEANEAQMYNCCYTALHQERMRAEGFGPLGYTEAEYRWLKDEGVELRRAPLRYRNSWRSRHRREVDDGWWAPQWIAAIVQIVDLSAWAKEKHVLRCLHGDLVLREATEVVIAEMLLPDELAQFILATFVENLSVVRKTEGDS